MLVPTRRTKLLATNNLEFACPWGMFSVIQADLLEESSELLDVLESYDGGGS